MFMIVLQGIIEHVWCRSQIGKENDVRWPLVTWIIGQKLVGTLGEHARSVIFSPSSTIKTCPFRRDSFFKPDNGCRNVDTSTFIMPIMGVFWCGVFTISIYYLLFIISSIFGARSEFVLIQPFLYNPLQVCLWNRENIPALDVLADLLEFREAYPFHVFCE